MRVLLVVVATLCVSVGAVSVAAASSPGTVAAKKDRLQKIKPSKVCAEAGEAPCLVLTTDFFKADAKKETYLRVVGANLLPQSEVTVTFTYLAPGDTLRQEGSFVVYVAWDGSLDSWTDLNSYIRVTCGYQFEDIIATATTIVGTTIMSNTVDSPCG